MVLTADDIRVVVCDDHALFRRGIVMALDDADDIEVVAEAADGVEAVEACAHLGPDVVLMDLRMPVMDGIEATRRVCERLPTTRVLMLTVSGDEDDLFEAVRAGATGYLLKESSIDRVGEAVRSLAAGHSFVSPELATRLLAEFRGRTAPRGGAGPVSADSLSEHEVDILGLLAAGGDNRSIAKSLGIPERRVRNHVANVLSRLHLRTRAEAVLYALREGIVEP